MAFGVCITGSLMIFSYAVIPEVFAVPRHGSLFEGDILGFGAGDADLKKAGPAANAIVDPRRKWPDNTVPYRYHSSYDESTKQLIRKAMDNIEDNTCVRFRPLTTEQNFIHIKPSSGCSSWIGKVGGEQTLSLDPGCISFGTVQHELMHALGFFHEQSRTDRDEYVEVNFDNLQKGVEGNFKSYTKMEIDGLGQPYDLDSAMHYARYDFAKNEGQWTIRPKAPNQDHDIGDKETLSNTDIKKINLLYQCPQKDKKMCGVLYENLDWKGLKLVVYEGNYDEFFNSKRRAFRSADIFSTAGCEFYMTTIGDEYTSLRLMPGKYDKFQPKHQTRMKGIACNCK